MHQVYLLTVAVLQVVNLILRSEYQAIIQIANLSNKHCKMLIFNSNH